MVPNSSTSKSFSVSHTFELRQKKITNSEKILLSTVEREKSIAQAYVCLHSPKSQHRQKIRSNDS